MLYLAQILHIVYSGIIGEQKVFSEKNLGEYVAHRLKRHYNPSINL